MHPSRLGSVTASACGLLLAVPSAGQAPCDIVLVVGALWRLRSG